MRGGGSLIASTNGALAFGGTEFGSSGRIRTCNPSVNHRDEMSLMVSPEGNGPFRSILRDKRAEVDKALQLLQWPKSLRWWPELRGARASYRSGVCNMNPWGFVWNASCRLSKTIFRNSRNRFRQFWRLSDRPERGFLIRVHLRSRVLSRRKAEEIFFSHNFLALILKPLNHPAPARHVIS